MALKKVVAPVFKEEDIPKMCREYSEISAQIKLLEEQKKSLADKIKSCVESFGVKNDKGSFYYESEDFTAGKVARKSVKIDNEVAVPYLESNNLGDVIDLLKVVNESKLEKALGDGRISIEDIKSFTKETVSYSVSVVENEDVTAEVSKSHLNVARKK